MQRSLKWALGIIGAIVVGALGSGLWSTVFAPLGSLLLKAGLSIVTLGIHAAKDSVYRQAAFGFRERSADLLLVALAEAILFLPLGFYLGRQLRRSSVSARAVKKWRRINHVLLIILALGSSILFVQLLMMVYANSVVANFNRSLAVAAPHISSEQRTAYLARFAKIRTRSDFIILFTEINSVLEQNSEPRSNFSPW
jgi:hypothetical protein